MAPLKSRFMGEPAKGLPLGTHKWPLLGSMTCGSMRSLSLPVCSDGASSFFFFTNSKNSATCLAYLHRPKTCVKTRTQGFAVRPKSSWEKKKVLLEIKPANSDWNRTTGANKLTAIHGQNLKKEITRFILGTCANLLSFSFYVFAEINVKFTIQNQSRNLHRKRH